LHDPSVIDLRDSGYIPYSFGERFAAFQIPLTTGRSGCLRVSGSVAPSAAS